MILSKKIGYIRGRSVRRFYLNSIHETIPACSVCYTIRHCVSYQYKGEVFCAACLKKEIPFFTTSPGLYNKLSKQKKKDMCFDLLRDE